MIEGYHKYAYDGPIIVFDRLVADHWKGETLAPSKRKARSNLAYQAKQQMNLLACANVKLPGEIKTVN